MNIRIGDLVKFISEKLEGKVTEIIDTATVNVYCEEYGFEIPASVTDLVVISPEGKVSPAKSVQSPGQKSVPTETTDTLYIALVPDNFQNLSGSRFEIHLVNDTNRTCLYSISSFNGKESKGITAGNCNPDTTICIGTYTLKELESIKSLLVQAIFYQKGPYTPKSAIDTQLKINVVSLCKAGNYKHTRWFPSMVLLKATDKESLQTEEIPSFEPLSPKEPKIVSVKPEKTSPKSVSPYLVEVDLHIDQLLETTAGMENKDILEYQLDTFRKTLEKYKLRRGQKIVFIHGKGDGVLKQRILWELQTRYKRFHHQDASFKQYGYGATLVTIK